MLIHSLRCNLRPPSQADKPHVLRFYTDIKVREFLGGPLSQAEAEKRWETLWTSESNELVWAIIRQVDQAFMGLVFLAPHHDSAQMELSYLFLPEFWGQGYAQETLQAMIEYAFEHLNLKLLVAETQTANLASCKLLERVGMSLEQNLTRFGAEQALYSIWP